MKTSVNEPQFDFIKTNIFNFPVCKICLGTWARRTCRAHGHVGHAEHVGHIRHVGTLGTPFSRLFQELPSDFFENIWDMGNCCFRGSSNKIRIEDNVVSDDRLIPEGAITLFYSKKFDCYMLTFELRNFETYSFRL